ncbi:hypothetical protein ACFL2H_09560 [Planctomycetota bacterium]
MNIGRASLTIALLITSLSSVWCDEPDYSKAKWNEIHRKPAILEASNQDCLKCHDEILKHKPLEASPAGLKADEVLAWYQTLDTYKGDQQSFHWRHLQSPYAKKVMDLKCNFCHQGNDPREEAPSPPTGKQTGFTLRKMVDVQKVCLKCHGTMDWKVMTLPAPMPAPWSECRDQYQNDCLSCHAVYRTVRHQVSYLKADAIEDLAKPTNLGGDVCYGCHGGRAWYRKGYPYPRHTYPGMDKIPVPEPAWAKKRPKHSESRYALPIEQPKATAQSGAQPGVTTTPQEQGAAAAPQPGDTPPAPTATPAATSESSSVEEAIAPKTQ